MKHDRLTRRNGDGTTWVKCAVCDMQDKCDYTKDTCCHEFKRTRPSKDWYYVEENE